MPLGRESKKENAIYNTTQFISSINTCTQNNSKHFCMNTHKRKEIIKYTRVEWLIVRRVMGVWGGAQAKSGRKGKREDSGQLFKDQN